EIMRRWKDIQVEPLLKLKKQFQKMDMEQREANLDEALISVAEKRLKPFLDMVSQPGHPLWKAATEVVSMVDDPSVLEFLILLLRDSPKESLPDLLKAIGHFNTGKAREALLNYLNDPEEEVMFEAVMALRVMGGSGVLGHFKDALAARRREGAQAAVSVLDEAIRELEIQAL
ncbi:MAG: HEAT repeat domain-containing protein, partial [Nitrospirota bacterium]